MSRSMLKVATPSGRSTILILIMVDSLCNTDEDQNMIFLIRIAIVKIHCMMIESTDDIEHIQSIMMKFPHIYVDNMLSY